MLDGGTPKFFTQSASAQGFANPCCIRGVIVHNNDSAARFLQIFNAKPADVTLGTTTPSMVFQIVANDIKPIGFFDSVFDTGFAFGITTLRAGGTAATTADIMVVIK